MKQWWNKIPYTFRRFLLWISLPLLLLTICRLLFWWYNSSHFPDAGFIEILAGVWFDLMTIGIVFIPFYILYFIPHPWRENRWVILFFRILFLITNVFLFAFNIIDIPYYEFTLKRSTADMFTMVGYGQDINNLWSAFLLQYWYFLLLFIGIIISLDIWFRKVLRWIPSSPNKIIIDLVLLPLVVIVFFTIGRGGWQLKPTSIITASKYTTPQNVPLVLNSAFTIIKTWNKKHLELKNYMPEEEARRTFNPVHHYKLPNSQYHIPEKTNVIVLVLESMSSEFIGPLNNGGKTYTPYLDSILEESYLLTNAYANGKKSIEAIPAITASIPTLMDNPYISSPYSGNKIDALPILLEKMNYSTAFYHAATNGSMNFDGFASLAGYDEYFGRYEYDNDDHFDGHWGIFDEYFLPWSVEKISEQRKPFFATIFTISSHHPYTIPDHHGDRFDTGDGAMYDATMYADYTLKLFFETAKKQDWFENTLFVITADHSPASSNTRFNNRYGMYQIPLAFYHPDNSQIKGRSNDVAQQCDIMPSVLDLLGYKKPFFAFGNSLFRNENRFAISYLSGMYNLIQDEYMMLYSNEDEPIQISQYTKDPYLVDNMIETKKKELQKYRHFIEAIIQQYNFALIKNKMSAQ